MGESVLRQRYEGCLERVGGTVMPAETVRSGGLAVAPGSAPTGPKRTVDAPLNRKGRCTSTLFGGTGYCVQ